MHSTVGRFMYEASTLKQLNLVKIEVLSMNLQVVLDGAFALLYMFTSTDFFL